MGMLLMGQRMSGMPLKRPIVAAILCLCSVRARPHVAERAESDASSTHALLPSAVDALVTNDAERQFEEFEFVATIVPLKKGRLLHKKWKGSNVQLSPTRGIRCSDDATGRYQTPWLAHVIAVDEDNKVYRVPRVRVILDDGGGGWMLNFGARADVREARGLVMRVYAALLTFTHVRQTMPLQFYRARTEYGKHHDFHKNDKWLRHGAGNYGDRVGLALLDRGVYRIMNVPSSPAHPGGCAAVTVTSAMNAFNPRKLWLTRNFQAMLVSVPVSLRRVVPALYLDPLMVADDPAAWQSDVRFLDRMVEVSNFRILDSDVAKEITHIVTEDLQAATPPARPRATWKVREIYVLPSQLNGAEYRKKGEYVSWLDKYLIDPTGGPAGQMAGHPSIAQVIIDNAQNNGMRKRGEGFLYTRAIPIPVIDGYMHLRGVSAEQVDAFKDLIHLVHGLAAVGVPAEGFQSRRPRLERAFQPEFLARGNNPIPRKLVDLMYASAAPANGAYDSPKRGARGYAESVQAAKLVLLSQYIAAFQHAAQTVANDPRYGIADEAPGDLSVKLVKLRLMPLGYGVFENKAQWIRDAMIMAYRFVLARGPPAVAGWSRPLDYVDMALLTYYNVPRVRHRRFRSSKDQREQQWRVRAVARRRTEGVRLALAFGRRLRVINVATSVELRAEQGEDGAWPKARAGQYFNDNIRHHVNRQPPDEKEEQYFKNENVEDKMVAADFGVILDVLNRDYNVNILAA